MDSIVITIKNTTGNRFSLLFLLLLYHSDVFPQTAPTYLENLVGGIITWDSVMSKRHGPQIQLQAFYKHTKYALAWQKPADIDELLFAIRNISSDGLNPGDYHLDLLQAYMEMKRSERQEAFFDLFLTDAFLELAEDLHRGRVDPEVLFPVDWQSCPRDEDFSALLVRALNGLGISNALESLKPRDNSYKALKRMLRDFREIQSRGGLPPIPDASPLEPGSFDERIPQLSSRLFILKLLPEGWNDENMQYDSLLVKAVKRFQRLHGLRPDGVIGKRTLGVLNFDIDYYIETIVVNLERYRWHQSRLTERSVKVNIPAYQLEASAGDSIELSMKVIVGRPDRRTPVLSSAITAMVFNPTWTVPPTILREDVLPAIKADTEFLNRNSMRVIDQSGAEIVADSLQWPSYSQENFPYLVREDPGPHNPLGQIKFQFPNDRTVFLHDTNVHSLFSQEDRALSSGCIRIESPMALARLLLKDSEWNEETLKDLIASGETKLILLTKPLSIHLIYFTAFVDVNGDFYMVRDLYGYDQRVLSALSGL